jgi:hypothetical protein
MISQGKAGEIAGLFLFFVPGVFVAERLSCFKVLNEHKRHN